MVCEDFSKNRERELEQQMEGVAISDLATYTVTTYDHTLNIRSKWVLGEVSYPLDLSPML